MKTGIPDRWLNYKNTGRQISGTRFITFKTPLKYRDIGHRRFTTRDLIDSCSNLGLIINLTFKTKSLYYDPQDIISAGIDYESLRIPGHILPDHSYIFKFYQIVEKFLRRNRDNDKLIGVHCTHGLNRTGYLVCRYMIDRLTVPPDQAIVEFNSARGHEQERQNYLNALRTENLNEEYHAWMKHISEENSNNAVQFAPQLNKHQGWQRYNDYAAPNYFQQMSRKRKSTEIVDDVYEENNHKRAKYSSDANLWRAENDRNYYENSASSARDIGESYYRQYYGGDVPQQYVMDYYHPRSSRGLGPGGIVNSRDNISSPHIMPPCTSYNKRKLGRSVSFTPQSNTFTGVSKESGVKKTPDRTAREKTATDAQSKRIDSTQSMKNRDPPGKQQIPNKQDTLTGAPKDKKKTIYHKFLKKLKFKKSKHSKSRKSN